MATGQNVMTRDELLKVIEETARTGAKELSLFGESIKELPPEIGQLTNLQRLVLFHNQLSALPPEIGQLTNLQQLSLSSNQLSVLPPEIRQLTNLQQLDLSSNQLSVLPPEIGQLTNLQQLDLSSNQLSALPPEIRQLTNLQQLDLSSNQLSALPPEIVQLTNLQQLRLGSDLRSRSNQLSVLPPEIRQLTNLQQLDLSSNQLSVLPPEIGQLTNLQQLDLSSNQLSVLPPEIGQLTNLQQLDLSSNQLSALPPEIGQLTNLQQFDLRSNNLSSLPPEILQIESLQQLDLSNNVFEFIPEQIFGLNNIQELSMGANQISLIPQNTKNLKNIRTLKLGATSLELNRITHYFGKRGNRISELPPEIGQLTNLQELDLSSNQLSALPPEIVQLSHLQQLNLSSNQLSALPPEIVQLTNLQELGLSSNQLSALPPEIVQLSHLKELNLRGNPLPIAPELLGSRTSYHPPSDVKTILDFYFATQDPTATETLYEAKFLIVGEGGAGKTSLAKKIQNPDYKLNPDEDSTHGIEVIQWRFPLEDGQEFRVNLWDFGGQEIYHQTHQFFLTERSLYALVADTRKENTDFPYWLNSIELFGGDSPVLVIKNEKGDRPCNVNERQLRGEFEYIKEFLPTNLQDGRGLDEIKAAIRYHITRLDYVGTPLPKKWVRVRYALENDARNFIDQRDYFALCQRNNVTDQTEMLQISDFLHKLGICLHFQKDRVLKHLVILRPEWATNAVYAITTHKKVVADKGLFTRNIAEQIWQKDYANMGDELLQLMENFNLCYPIPGLLDHYIAPQLLDFDPPPYTWDETQNLMLRYEYEFMPKGIVTQLIVSLYRWIEQQQLVWRSGVVFNNGRARAEVIETYRPYKGEIRIRVAGVHSKELLSVITHELDAINDSFEKIKVMKRIPCNCEECVSDPEPHFFRLRVLDRYLEKGRFQITCDKSCLDVSVRSLTAVVPRPSFDPLANDREFEGWKRDKREEVQQNHIEALKQQHTELYQPMSDSKFSFSGAHIENLQINESIQGDAVIHKYANDPQVKESLSDILEFLKTLQREYPEAKPDQADEILTAEIVKMETTQPQRWQQFQQQIRNLPKDLRNRERLMQAGKSALIQVTTDLTDNIFLNAFIAFLDGLSSEP